MAINTDKGIRGMVGKAVFYIVKGRNLIRSKPGKRKKKRGQKPNPINTIFGTVSRFGTRMIGSMRESFLFPFTIETYNHARGWMRDQYAANNEAAIWELRTQNNLMSQLNPEADLRDFWGIPITVSDEGGWIVHIGLPAINPAKDLKVPLRTVKINLKMIMVCSPFTEAPWSISMEQYHFDYSENILPAKTITIDSKYWDKKQKGLISLVVLALEFETEDSGKGVYNTDKRWLPAAIVAMGRLKD